MENKYCCKCETHEHIKAVQKNLISITQELLRRALVHDDSKLVEPEASIFERETPTLKGLTYGSEEYKAALARLGEALSHHYENNSHHPEHHVDGMNGFDLCDLVEMFCDWGAATMRHENGSIEKSIVQNESRFSYPPMIKNIFNNSVRLLECKKP